MRPDLFLKTEEYFNKVWGNNHPKWLSGNVEAAQMIDGKTVPLDYCLSTIARVNQQAQNHAAAIEEVKERLKAVASKQHFYPADSTHITLLGCTPRLSQKEQFPIEQREKISLICTTILEGYGPVRMTLKGVGIIGNQVFIQVYPYDQKWESLRQALEDALKREDENPISYPNKAPIHMNILRIVDSTPSKLSDILKLVSDLRSRMFGEMEVTLIDYLLTDFVVSPSEIEVIKQIRL